MQPKCPATEIANGDFHKENNYFLWMTRRVATRKDLDGHKSFAQVVRFNAVVAGHYKIFIELLQRCGNLRREAGHSNMWFVHKKNSFFVDVNF